MEPVRDSWELEQGSWELVQGTWVPVLVLEGPVRGTLVREREIQVQAQGIWVPVGERTKPVQNIAVQELRKKELVQVLQHWKRPVGGGPWRTVSVRRAKTLEPAHGKKPG